MCSAILDAHEVPCAADMEIVILNDVRVHVRAVCLTRVIPDSRDIADQGAIKSGFYGPLLQISRTRYKAFDFGS